MTSVFYGADHITVTKDSATPWAHVKPEVFSLITEAVTSGQPIVNTIEGRGEKGQGENEDTLARSDDDDDVVDMIKELLETRIRPAIQEDGGDIDFRGFVDGQVLLKLRGACRTCDSSTVTLKNGIESMVSRLQLRTMACDADHSPPAHALHRRGQGSATDSGPRGRGCYARVCEIRGETQGTKGTGCSRLDCWQGQLGHSGRLALMQCTKTRRL